MGASSFDEAAQEAFKIALMNVINSSQDGSSNSALTIIIIIIGFADVSQTFQRRHDVSLGAFRTLSAELQVDWSLQVVVQELLPADNPTDATDEDLSSVATVLNEMLTDEALTEELQDSSTTFAQVAAVVSEIDSNSIEVTLLRSPNPTSAPTSTPTGLYKNAKLDQTMQYVPLNLSQFFLLTSFSVFILLTSPWIISCYRRRGKQLAKEKKKWLKLQIFQQNKNKLSEEERARRENMRLAFRERYGRDIDVYGDCRPVPTRTSMKDHATSNLAPRPITHAAKFKPPKKYFKSPRSVPTAVQSNSSRNSRSSSPSSDEQDSTTNSTDAKVFYKV